MPIKNIALAFACLAFNSHSFAQGFGQSKQISEWQFSLSDDVSPLNLDASEQDWRPVIVPHDWSVEYPAHPDNASCTGYLPGGIGWYHTELEIETNAEQRRYLYFEGVYNRSQVYVNGTLVGERPNGYVSFLYDITPYLETSGSNQISVRVDHSRSADSRWYTGSGIYRPVHLVTAKQIHFALWGIHYQATVDPTGNAALSISSSIENHLHQARGKLALEHTLIDPDGKRVASETIDLTVEADSQSAFTTTLEVANARLWSVAQPQLYRLESRLTDNGKLIDESATRVGIRALHFDPEQGFALNGQNMKIKGVCIHHDAGVLGAAVPKAVWRERLRSLKEIGVNGIRMSHNPQATDLYDLCDEMGFLVMDEAFDEWEYPKKKWIEGWNKGEPGFQGAADFFHEWGERDLEAMVKRDRNHPSIIMWSIGNEVDYPNDPYSHPVLDEEGIGQQHVAGYQKDQPHAERLGDIAKRLAAVVRRHDTSRPVTAALAGAVMSNETAYPETLDIVGYNYTEYRYAKDHETYPERVLYGSETRHDLAAWKSVANNGFIFGQFIWTGFDYLGESGPWPSRGFTTGMVDLANQIKPRGHFRRALWSEKPVAYLGSYPNTTYLSMDAGRNWNYQPGQIVRVVCYTNGEEAELLLDGKTVGERKPYDSQSAIIHWDIPYQAGELKVVAYANGQKIATDTIRPDGQVAAIKTEVLSEPLAGTYAVSVVAVSLVDSLGRRVYGDDQTITCTVAGAGRLLGLENASHDASENHRDNQAATKRGYLVAYIQATEDHGNIQVEFAAPGLPSSTLTFDVSR
ncbi:glycoside hydrolase family 2 TIM barrel-domain containing protein [Pelagicoccus sp. SDUM812005]|uniref:glycoside hydrolase family 2 TIM barrel-domain containing protein n=1 Tax=Pelagicoccus sp. SDUM812005 TaxID=3041257 RepID=UPI00280D6677|nr:glycoside hydrolase family 2 TIM barrel-domain containing protein [Pelagicoccus sp. SDUM812005]MDQ8181033.1 glycoside hydrolase family 2 TIM barrel-domain containing protein [Pelagicoccus sp. SDUM812005]